MANLEPENLKLGSQLPGYIFVVAGHVDTAPGVAYLELARPQRHNSFHEDLWIEFPRALRQLDADEATRVIVIAGQGRNFCAGIDVGFLQRNFLSVSGSAGAAPAAASGAAAGDGAAAAGGGDGGGRGGQPRARPCPGEQRASMRRDILALQDAYTELERCRSPVIAAVHGRCIGGGVDLITACDLRICSDDASFCVKEVDLAIAADLGTLQRLPHIVGHAVAMDLALTARTLGAAEAKQLGLVSAVVPSVPAATATSVPPTASGRHPDGGADGGGGGGGEGGRAAVVAAAVRLGSAIASKPRLAVQGTKRVLLHARDQPRVSDGLDYVATWNSAQLLSRDLEAAMQRMAGGGTGGGRGGGGGGREHHQERQAPRARL